MGLALVWPNVRHLDLAEGKANFIKILTASCCLHLTRYECVVILVYLLCAA